MSDGFILPTSDYLGGEDDAYERAANILHLTLAMVARLGRHGDGGPFFVTDSLIIDTLARAGLDSGAEGVLRVRAHLEPKLDASAEEFRLAARLEAVRFEHLRETAALNPANRETTVVERGGYTAHVLDPADAGKVSHAVVSDWFRAQPERSPRVIAANLKRRALTAELEAAIGTPGARVCAAWDEGGDPVGYVIAAPDAARLYVVEAHRDRGVEDLLSEAAGI